MGRAKGNMFRRQFTPQLATRDNKKKPVAGSKTTQRWARTKHGVTFQSQSKVDDAPNPRARWIDVKVPSKYPTKCLYLGFRDAWTPEYRRDAVWVQVPVDPASKLCETLNAFTSTRPIGFHLSKKTAKDDEVSISLSDLFRDTDASWLSDVTALIAQDLLTVEVHVVDNNGEPLTLLQSAPRRRGSSQPPKFALSIGIAWQRYMDVCLYKPGFAWPPTELVHTQMHRAMLWVLRASRLLSNQWSFRDHEELDRLFDEFVCSGNGTDAREELKPPAESTCVEFERGGISLGYDPYRACFLGLL